MVKRYEVVVVVSDGIVKNDLVDEIQSLRPKHKWESGRVGAVVVESIRAVSPEEQD